MAFRLVANSTTQWVPLENTPSAETRSQQVPILIMLGSSGSTDRGSSTTPEQLLRNLNSWTQAANVELLVPSSPGNLQDPRQWNYECPPPGCSSPAQCHALHDCIYKYMSEAGPATPLDTTCIIGNVYPHLSASAGRLSCLLEITPRGRSTGCGDIGSLLTAETWRNAATDKNLQVFVEGGVDTEGLWWPGSSGDFSQALFSQLLGSEATECSLNTPCNAILNCHQVGSRLSKKGAVSESRWGILTLIAVINMNKALASQYAAVRTSGSGLGLETLNLDQFFPRPNPSINLSKAWAGMSTAFALTTGVMPNLSTPFGSIGLMVSALGDLAKSQWLEIPAEGRIASQKTIQPLSRDLLERWLDAYNAAVSNIFKGKRQGEVNITKLLWEGAWIDTKNIQAIGAGGIDVEFASRAVNELWKTAPSNKVWVSFVDLHDDPASPVKCFADNTGPQQSKFCGDGGVYYSFNLIETGNLQAYVSYPWGTDHLREIGIEPQVSKQYLVSTAYITKSVLNSGLLKGQQEHIVSRRQQDLIPLILTHP